MDGRRITLLDLYKMWPLFRDLEGMRVAAVYRSGECLSMRLRASGRERWLLFHPRIGPVAVEQWGSAGENYAPLKRYMKGRRVDEVALLNGDRVLSLRGGRVEIILEWVREGNILLLEDGVIRHALRRRRMRDRSLEPGVSYTPPPRQPSVFEVTPEEVVDAVGSSKRRLVTAFAAATGLPGELSYEALYRAGVDPMAKAHSVEPGAVKEAYWKARSIYVESLSSDLGYLAGRDLYPFLPSHRAEPIREVRYLAEAPRYYAAIIGNMCGVEEKPRSLGEKLREALAEVEAEIRVLEVERLRIEKIVEEYRRLRGSRVPWSLIEEELSAKYPEFRGANHSKWLLELEYGGVEVEVNARGGLYKTLEARYNALKRLRERIASMPEEPQEKSSGAAQPEKRKRRWYEDFRYFITSGGFLVVAGRSAGQNELLVRRYLGEDDIFLHADIHGAPATILKTEGRAPDEHDIEEAAQFAASYSSAWEAGLYAVDVYWVWGKQVSKKAPSGEYLGKGAFMVYGKRNYLRRVKLSLAVGYNPDEGLVALPAITLGDRRGCYLVLEPGRAARRLVVDKILRLILKECGARRLQSGDVERLLPRGGFYIARRVVRP